MIATKTFLIWGFDLGLGFSTIRVSALFWIVALTTLLLVPPHLDVAVMIGYGAGVALSVVLSVAVTCDGSPAALRDRLVRSPSVVRLVLAAATAAFLIALAGNAVA